MEIIGKLVSNYVMILHPINNMNKPLNFDIGLKDIIGGFRYILNC